jgi:lipopolysaccharide biosynthesis glycosyltransferase
MISFYDNHPYYFTTMDKVTSPRIIHYLTGDKPWKTVSTSGCVSVGGNTTASAGMMSTSSVRSPG